MGHNTFGLIKLTQRASAATPPTRKSPNITTSRGGAYITGRPEQAIEDMAAEDGQSDLLNPGTVGVNSHPEAIDGLVHAHEAAAGVIGHDGRDELQEIDAELEKDLLAFEATKAETLDANGRYESAERERILQWRDMRESGLPIPSKKATFILVLAMVGLFGGDWSLITLGYQVLGLSDRPWLPGVAVTDDLHLAAFSSVFALVVLGDGAGERLRRIEHALDRRRRAGETERDRMPGPARFDFLWLAVCLLGALGGLTALSYIRSEYLKAVSADTGGLAFFGIQLAILLAAIALGFAHAHPEAKRWRSSARKAREAEAALTNSTADCTKAASKVNAGVDLHNTTLAKIGHHVGVHAADTSVGGTVYKRRYSLSQPEPAQERLFGEHLTPPRYTETELLAKITGIAEIPTFKKVTTGDVMCAREKTRTRLEELRARIDQLEITRLNLPPLEDGPSLSASAEDGRDPHAGAVTASAEAPAATPLRPVREPASDNEATDDEETA